MIKQRIDKLRSYMRQAGVDAWLVTTADFHDSEYAGDYFKLRAFLSGFTGSAGNLVVLADEAGLWTDGRYFVQADLQLKDSGITLHRQGQKGVLTIPEFLKEKLPEGGCLGFDGRTVSQKYYRELKRVLGEKKIRFFVLEDLGGRVWEDRPPLSCQKIWLLDEKKYAGRSVQQKLTQVREKMKEAGAGLHLLTSLDDIAWLYNMRGSDVECNPVALSYAAVTPDQALLFIQEKAVEPEVKKRLEEAGVTLRPYEAIYEYASSLKGETVLLDSSRVNCAIYARLPQGVTIVDQMNPETVLKAVKNETEQENIRKAHIKDGVAVSRFICWLKKNIGKIPMTELRAAVYLDGMRAQQEGFLDLSFGTISAYGSNAAMCHYSATEESDTPLKPEGFLLVDSGGQYLEGTTDITRTIVLGPVTEKQKFHYTLVLKGMIALAAARFTYGCTGANLDVLARGPLWKYGLDYNHGTGHGVGYLLNVHEGPNRIHWNVKTGSCIMEPGMLTSDEPGFYLEGEYGIRTENLILCKEEESGEYSRILSFETVTLAPIDLEAIDWNLMTHEEIEWLNSYHEKVYRTLSPYLEKEEADWLKEACRRIS